MAEKKKILYIVEAMGGGVFTYIVDLANELVNKYDMYIAYAVRKQTPKNYKDYFDKRIHLIEVKNFGRAINPTKDIAAFFELKKIAAEVKPDVIHLHSSKAGAIGRVAFDGKIPMFYAKVARAIKTVFYALDVVNQGMQEKQSITVRCVDIEDLEKQAEAIRVEQIKLYESYADGVLRRDVYIEKKKTLSEKLAALQDSIRTEKEEQECADELDEEIRTLTKQASEKTYIGGLTKECVDAFVSMVYLYDDQTMKIEFNCEDVIRRAMEKYGT